MKPAPASKPSGVLQRAPAADSRNGGAPDQPPIADLWGPALLRSERLRAGALVVILIVFECVIGVLAAAPGVFPAGSAERYRASLLPLSLILLSMAFFEAFMGWWIGRVLRERSSLPMAFRYASLLVECSAPAFIMWVWSGAAGPVQTLSGALPWLYFPFIAASSLHLNGRLCVFGGAVAAAGFIATAHGLMRNVDVSNVAATALIASPISYILKGIMILVGGFVAAFVADQLKGHLRQAIQTARERDRAVSIFGQHVSPQVAQRLIGQPVELAGELRHVCVMFFDIRGFTRYATDRTPAEVMAYLNTLFAPLIALVNQHGGIVNKFLGDGFMAIFGAPFEDPLLHRNAVRCASAMLQCVEQLNASGAIPETRIGIGIHAGLAVAGNVGSTERKEYTVLGETVNVASRIEQATKESQARILVSEAVMAGVSDESVQAEDIGSIALRGVSQPVRLFKLA